MVSEILHIPLERELGVRSRWLIEVRWLVIGLAVLLVLALRYLLRLMLPMAGVWITLGLITLYNSLFWIIAHRLTSRTASPETHSFLIHIQVAADLASFTAILHLTGGLENPFAAYYTLLVLIGSILTTRRASLIYASLASLLWVGLLVSEAAGWIPHYNLAGYRLPMRYTEPVQIVSVSCVLISLNLTVAFFTSGIMRRLREGEQQLYAADQSCELRAGELARLNERLRELDRSRAMFIRLVTHELRAPVAAIQSYLRLILDGYVPAERLTEIVTRAEQRSRDQLTLIGDLLDLARAQDPSETAPLERVDASDSLARVVDLLQVRAQDKHLAIETHIQDELFVEALPAHIEQIWMNLVSNAIKYTPEGGRITITLEPHNGRLRGCVQDTGIGMTKDELARIFEPFYRTETAKATAAQGTGLGLSIVQGIVARYHGRVWAESQPGQGSTFTVELPLAD